MDDAQRLRSLLTHQKVVALMPYTSDVYGCSDCYVFWVDNAICWNCDQPGTLLASAYNKADAVKQAFNRRTT